MFWCVWTSDPKSAHKSPRSIFFVSTDFFSNWCWNVLVPFFATATTFSVWTQQRSAWKGQKEILISFDFTAKIHCPRRLLGGTQTKKGLLTSKSVSNEMSRKVSFALHAQLLPFLMSSLQPQTRGGWPCVHTCFSPHRKCSHTCVGVFATLCIPLCDEKHTPHLCAVTRAYLLFPLFFPFH